MGTCTSYRRGADRHLLDHGVMIGPRLFQAMRKLLHGLHPPRSPRQKASRGGAQAADQPDQTFHSQLPVASYGNPPRQTHVMRRARSASALPDYTERMDRVALGRALGYGTRHAAKTLLRVEAAGGVPCLTPLRGSAEILPLPGDTGALHLLCNHQFRARAAARPAVVTRFKNNGPQKWAARELAVSRYTQWADTSGLPRICA